MFVFIFPELRNLTGIAAILRFPLPEIEENVDNSDSESDEDQSDHQKKNGCYDKNDHDEN